MVLHVDPERWGVCHKLVKIVYDTVRNVLVNVFEKTPDASIWVKYGNPKFCSSPWCSYIENREYPYEITISAFGAYWCRHVYEFSHEMCHVMINSRKIADYQNSWAYKHSWFDETICEMGSLYVLHKLSDDLANHQNHSMSFTFEPPLIPALVFKNHVKNIRIKRPFSGKNPVQWFQKNKHVMENATLTMQKIALGGGVPENLYERKLQSNFASAILPYFLKEPTLWRELGKLNLWNMISNQEFQDYLNDWEDTCRTQNIDPKVPSILRQKFGIPKSGR